MSLVISKVFTYDTDAGNYIQAVEAADGQALEAATRQAINNFVVGCKADGIWSAIKASCILAGARTLSGALVPLVGTAPTNNNFVSGDYNRKTGLVGNGSTKYLNSNRASSADPQDNIHVAIYSSTIFNLEFAFGSSASGASQDMLGFNGALMRTALHSNVADTVVTPSSGLHGLNRNNSSSYIVRQAGIDFSKSFASTAPQSFNHYIFTRNFNNAPNASTNARLAFYSIGESLDLALLDARVTALITAFGAAIP